LNKELKGKYLKGRPRSRWEQHVRRNREGEHERKLRRRRRAFAKTEINGEAWLLGDRHETETSKKVKN
jgi:hypothetical protein